jgi:putative phage-type endonuclease
MKVLDCIQGSEEWMAARVGKVGASRIADIVAKTKSGYSASRANYAADLIAERLTGKKADSYTNVAMQWGTDNEPAARAMYEFMHNALVTEVGIVLHPSIQNAQASPDGLVGDDGLVEIKCPLTATHIATLRGGEIDGKYVKQMQWQMACTGRAWCDFCSFDPRMPAEMQLHVRRVNRDAVMIVELEREVRAFLAEIDATIAELTAKYMPTAEAAE